MAIPVEPLSAETLDAARADLVALVRDYADLEQLLIATGTRAVFVTGTREPPVPYNVGIDALQHDIWHFTTMWEEIVRDECGLSAPAVRVRRGWAVQHAVKILNWRIDVLSRIGPTAVLIDGQPTEQDGMGALATFTALHRRALSALGLTRHVDRLYGICLECQWQDLRRDSGSEDVYCGQCGAKRSWDDYLRWAALVEADADPKIVRRLRRG